MKIPLLLIILALMSYGCASSCLSELENPNEKYSSEILASARLSPEDRSKALQMIASKEDHQKQINYSLSMSYSHKENLP